MSTNTTSTTMTNPELIPEKAGGNLPSVSPPTTAPTEVENISLNPLFQPDLLEHLAQTSRTTTARPWSGGGQGVESRPG